LARAFFDQPPILVLDEPNAHLDTDGERALTRALSLHRERNGSALVIAQRTAILSVCDRVILMVDGKIAADGTLDQILEFTGLRPSGVETAKPVGALRASPKSKQNDLSHEAVDQSSEIESAS
jgi:ABC-type protease/lipase transport system, ATPase and permease components